MAEHPTTRRRAHLPPTCATWETIQQSNPCNIHRTQVSQTVFQHGDIGWLPLQIANLSLAGMRAATTENNTPGLTVLEELVAHNHHAGGGGSPAACAVAMAAAACAMDVLQTPTPCPVNVCKTQQTRPKLCQQHDNLRMRQHPLALQLSWHTRVCRQLPVIDKCPHGDTQ